MWPANGARVAALGATAGHPPRHLLASGGDRGRMFGKLLQDFLKPPEQVVIRRLVPSVSRTRDVVASWPRGERLGVAVHATWLRACREHGVTVPATGDVECD